MSLRATYMVVVEGQVRLLHLEETVHAAIEVGELKVHLTRTKTPVVPDTRGTEKETEEYRKNFIHTD